MNIILLVLLSIPSYSLEEIASRSTDIVRAELFFKSDDVFVANILETYRGTLQPGQEIKIDLWDLNTYSKVHRGTHVVFLKKCIENYQIAGQNSGAYQLIDGRIFSFARKGPYSMSEINFRKYASEILPSQTTKEPCITKQGGS